jgi:hypothetical protein
MAVTPIIKGNILSVLAAGSTSASPGGIGNTSFLQAGLAYTFTPQTTGNVLAHISGNAGSNTAIANCSILMSYGTGNAPGNGTAAAGSTVGVTQVVRCQTLNDIVSVFSLVNAIPNLTVGTKYWLDLQLKSSSSADAAIVENVNYYVLEYSEP